MASDMDFEAVDRLAGDRPRLRKEFIRKIKRVASRLPFAEDLLAAFYCAFDAQTPRHVQAALLGALAYFVMPFDAIPDVIAGRRIVIVETRNNPASWSYPQAPSRSSRSAIARRLSFGFMDTTIC